MGVGGRFRSRNSQRRAGRRFSTVKTGALLSKRAGHRDQRPIWCYIEPLADADELVGVVVAGVVLLEVEPPVLAVEPVVFAVVLEDGVALLAELVLELVVAVVLVLDAAPSAI